MLMESLPRPALNRFLQAGIDRRQLVWFGAFLLATFLSAALPFDALAREMTPTELITTQLPKKKTLKSATQSEFLNAICAAVRKRQSAAAAITGAAVKARRETAADVVSAVLRCSGKVTCESVESVVAAAANAEGDAAKISDAARAKAPECEEIIRTVLHHGSKPNERADTEPIPEQGALIGTSSGPDEGFDPHEPLSLVCDGGTPRGVRNSQLDDFFRSHPGSYPGPCQSVPAPDR
jgi:hypothetical protein